MFVWLLNSSIIRARLKKLASLPATSSESPFFSVTMRNSVKNSASVNVFSVFIASISVFLVISVPGVSAAPKYRQG